MKNQKGITLIALVITIIVMLILVAVVLTIALGDNGILKKAREAGNETKDAYSKEEDVFLDKDNTLSDKIEELKNNGTNFTIDTRTNVTNTAK